MRFRPDLIDDTGHIRGCGAYVHFPSAGRRVDSEVLSRSEVDHTSEAGFGALFVVVIFASSRLDKMVS
jgi:hypothetical protein